MFKKGDIVEHFNGGIGEIILLNDHFCDVEWSDNEFRGNPFNTTNVICS